MKMRAPAIGIGLLLIVLGIGFWLLRSSPAPTPSPPAALAPAPAPAPSAPAAEAPTPQATGTLVGEVSLVGTPPTMEPLKRGSDPVCAKTAMYDESALVKGGKIANVVVRVKDGPTVAAPASAVEVDQQDCMYRPRVQGAVLGQIVTIRNTDGTLHNVHSYAGSKTLFNKAQPPRSAAFDRKFEEGAGVIKFKCDVHPWMTGYVFVNNNPYFATTTADGKFEIKGVPAGTWQLEAWHEKFGTKTLQVTVKPNETTTVSVSYSASDRG